MAARNPAERFDPEGLERLLEGLAGPGWACVDALLPESLWRALAARAWRLERNGALREAGIGRAAARHARIRGDRIRWLEAAGSGSAERRFLEWIEALRVAINRRLWLGLLDYEGHYALYPPGARYRRHLDRPRDRPERTVTLICYLNADWSAADGGALRLHLDDGAQRDLLPLGGRVLAFLSARFEHEVLPARRARLALTGWFRRRPAHGLAW